MATAELLFKIRSDSAEFKTTMAQVRSGLKQIQQTEAQGNQSAVALQRQRSAALIAEWKRQEQERTRSASQSAKAVEQEERRLAATMIREARAAQAARTQAERATLTARTQATRQAAAGIQRFERERQQINTQTSRAITTLAKSEADARIREGRRATNAIIAQLQQELQQARATQGQVAQTRRGGTFLAGAAGGLTALLGVSAISEIRQAGAAWLDYSANLEATKIAFTTMLGSAEAATAHLKELQQFALTTPFQFDELIAASQRMQALGIASEQVVPLLNDIGNAVAAAGGGSEKLDRVVLAISQIQSKGKVATQELNQLAESGISGFKILEEATGKTRAELVKLVEQGKISSAEFIAAFQTFSQQNFGGLMEAQSKTFLGAMSNIKDALLQTSQTAFQPLYDRLTELARRMADTSTKSKEFREDMAVVGRELARVWDGAVEAIHIVHDAYRLVLSAIFQQIGITVHAFQALMRAIQSAVFAFQALAAIMRGDLDAAYTAIQRSNQQARLSLLEMRDAVIAAGGVWREFGNIMDRAAARGSAAANSIAVSAQIIAALGTGGATRQVLGGDISAGAGILRPRSVPIGGGGGGGRTKVDPAIAEAEREAKQRLDFFAQLQEQIRKLRDELNFVDTSTRTYAVSQAILNGVLKDASPEFKNMAEAAAKSVDNLTTQLRLQKELGDFVKQQAEAVRLVIEGEKSHLRVAQDLIESLTSQGAVLQETTKFWLQHNATILDAATAMERLIKANQEGAPLLGGVEVPKTVVPLEELGVLPDVAVPVIDQTRNAIDDLFAAFEDNSAALAGLGALETAFQGIGSAVGEAARAFVLFGSAGTSVRKVTAEILASVAQQAAVRAIFELAQGFAALALAFFGIPNAGPSAAAHFQAAALFGVVAGVAAVAGRAVAGNSFSKSGGGEQGAPGSSPTEDRDRTIRERRTGGAFDPNVAQNVNITLKLDSEVLERANVKLFRKNGSFRSTLRNDLLGEATG